MLLSRNIIIRFRRLSIHQISKKFCSSVLHSKNHYDVVVVGGGHAGTEACAAAARMGVKTLLITHKKSTIGAMSCNPSFGGIGKGHLMKEVDALDGVCGRICDITGISYRILNKSKGPAVWGYRAQIDRSLYKKELQKELFHTKNLHIKEASVEDLILESSDLSGERLKCCGVILGDGEKIFCSSLVLTTGTFLRGTINFGLEVKPAGRMGDLPAIGLAKTLERLNFKLGRLKTGTPPRLDKNTIDFSNLIVQHPDNPPRPFSFLTDSVWIKSEDQLKCFMTYTNEKVVEVVKKTLHLNRHVREEVEGPRYCPSLESKVLRFSNQEHQIWLEPEGLDSSVIYPQGLSCTMPLEYQQELVRHIRGLEKAEIVQPGYGVEYDYVNPQELTTQLETKKILSLYFAGQINGTTGYEEAAAQGIVAGINAAAKSQKKEGITIDRTEGYIGVLIDDLTTHGTSEPYRMFTSRSEFRVRLRPDNADIRLTKKGYDVGCVSEERYKKMNDALEKITYWKNQMRKDIRKNSSWQEILPDLSSSKANANKSLFHVFCNIPFGSAQLDNFIKNETKYKALTEDLHLFERIRLEAMYEYAISKEESLLNMVQMNQALVIPDSTDYYSPNLSLSIEVREKLSSERPKTTISHFLR